MRRVKIKIPDFIKSNTIIKDLQDDEVICNKCEGLGLSIENNPYGLIKDNNLNFNYVNQSITFCTNCFNGVQKICTVCKKNLGRNYNCNCKGYNTRKSILHNFKNRENYLNSNKILYDDYIKQYPDEIIYDDNTEEYFNCIDELICYYEDIDLNLPEYVYATKHKHIQLDVQDILENECIELYEGVIDNLNNVIELIDFIDNFNKINKDISTTYFPNYKLIVLI